MNKLIIFTYSIFVLNVIGLILVAIFLDWLTALVCLPACFMVWYNADKIRRRQKYLSEVQL